MNSNMYDGAMATVPQLVKCPSQVSCAHSKTKRNLKTVLGFFSLSPTVCETKNLAFNVSHDRINCEDKPVKVCFNETDKKGDKICRNVTQTVCDVQKGTKIDKFPETEVITMNNQSSK